MEKAYNGHQWISHFNDYKSKAVLVYTHPKKSDAILIIEAVNKMIRIRFDKAVNFLQTDDEQALSQAVGSPYHDLKRKYGFVSEPSAPYSKQQNGASERSGGILTMKARALKLAASIPRKYRPEIYIATAYILNRTPTKALNWKTPFEMIIGKKPSIGHMRAYGCKCYPLRGESTYPKLQRLEPRAYIGYLIGYDGTNIYRVWIPSRHRIIRVRDVTFKEDELYDHLDPDMGALEETRSLVELIIVLDAVAEYELLEDPFQGPIYQHNTNENAGPADDTEVSPQTPGAGDGDQYPSPPSTGEGGNPPNRRDETPSDTAEGNAYSTTTQKGKGKAKGKSKENTAKKSKEVSADMSDDLILPECSKRTHRPKVMATMSQSVEDLGFHMALAMMLTNENPPKINRNQLPPEPKTYRAAVHGKFKMEWKAACNREIDSLKAKDTWLLVDRETIGPNEQILPLKWVFKYEFDDEGFLTKLKARICVRGDLQFTDKDTYAATLAAKTFRCLMAMAAAFDMEVRQFDTINAFNNPRLPENEQVYCRLPEGFEIPGQCILLLNVLYGLKRSPALWYDDLTNSFEKLGLKKVPGWQCLYQTVNIMAYFYVDDILLACLPRKISHLEKLEEKLIGMYDMKRLGDIRWFLGIRVIRDRPKKKIWQIQDAYIEKIADRFSCERMRGKPH